MTRLRVLVVAALNAGGSDNTAGPEGSIFILDQRNQVFRKIDTNNIITRCRNRPGWQPLDRRPQQQRHPRADPGVGPG